MKTIRTLSGKELVAEMEESFRQQEVFTLLVTGHSMRPFLRHLRDGVTLASPAVRPPEAGNIVLFQRKNGKCVLHRILKQEKGGFSVCGDAQLWTEQVSREQIIGVVSALWRGNRWIPAESRSYRAAVWCWYHLPGLRRCIIRMDETLCRVREKVKIKKQGV